jgi:basic amino acid/polyamine antiporter, APA family
LAQQRDRAGSGKGGNGEDFTRDLRLTGAMAIGLGTMMGAGIFVLSADAASQAGPAATISFIIAGLIMLPVALAVSELVTAMPREGGSYHLISRTLGPAAGAVVGPANWLGLAFAGGFYLVGFAHFLNQIVPAPDWLVTTAVGLLFAAVNYRGAHMTGRVQTYIVAVLLLILLGFAGVGAFSIEAELHQPFAPEGWGAVLGVIGLIIVGFTGFEKISTVAEEVKDPGRNLPLAILGSVVVATVVYAAVLFVFTGVMPQGEITADETALIDAAERGMGAVGRYMMLAGGLLATASSANAALLASSRIGFAMGRDRILPGWLARIHPAHHTPHHAILVTAAISMLLALTGEAARLAEISSAMFIISYVLILAGVVVMRRIAPDWYDPPFRVPLHPWVTIAGALAVVSVLATMERISQLAGLGMAVASIAWYFAWGRRRSDVHGVLGDWVRRTHPLDRLRSVFGGGDDAHGMDVPSGTETAAPAAQDDGAAPAILVGLTTSTAATPMLQLAAAMAPGVGARQVVALHVRKAPGTLSLPDAREAMHGTEPEDAERLRGAVADVRGDVPVRFRHDVARSVAAGILHAAREHGAVRMILLGDDGPDLTRGLRSEIDADVARRASCDVGILVNAERLPAEASPRRVLAVEPEHGGHHVVHRLADALEAAGARVDRVSGAAPGQVLERAHGYDLVIIHSGGGEDGEDRVFHGDARRIMQQADGPVLVAHCRRQ